MGGVRTRSTWPSSAELAGGAAGAGLELETPFRRIQEEYLQLLTGIPECIEAYEASNASGATLRRFAIVQDSVRVCYCS